ncbi:MAG: Asp-tRNA(Asn)/Glu-tRNA(Gln) amidotransferase subunit GatB [Spirochaetaceae bacterium]
MYQTYVGLEIHIQLQTQSKVFCGCRANFGDEPNTNVCPVCLGYPGVLPSLNEEAIRMGYLVARALNCDLARECTFERKNYFYPDLPKNYQISQFAQPLGTNGYLDLTFRKKTKRVRIHEVHLEEDAGKMIHVGDISLCDYNRAGTPLLEIVTEPDLEIGEEAEVLLQELRRIVRYLGVCDGNMEEGSMRCDANSSVNLRGAGLGSKVEIKNLNSSRFVKRALNFELDRQQEILERGGSVQQETRLWNENRDLTESMRTKENANDYRYFPEPDLPPFRATEEFLQGVESMLLELPPRRRERFVADYHVSEAQAAFLCEEKPLADFFEATVAAGASPQEAATWLQGDVRKLLNRREESLSASNLTPGRLAQLLTLLSDGRIHGKIAKQTLEMVFEEDRDPGQIIKGKGWEQITDAAELSPIIDTVLRENESAVAQIREGDAKPMGYLVGRIMKATEGRAEPKLVQSILKEQLSYEVIEVLSFGGAIAGVRQEDGLIVPGTLAQVSEEVARDPELPDSIRFDEVELGEFLSEEIVPEDWARLIHTIQVKRNTSNASAIVVGHGTDTLAYTASLLYWFFADIEIPLVLTAAAVPRENAGERSDAVENLKAAVRLAMEADGGVHVVYGDNDFYPVNLKFEHSGYTVIDQKELPGVGDESAFYFGRFRNWNKKGLTHRGPAFAKAALDLPEQQLARRLEEAVRGVFIAKVFPGMRGETLIALMESGVRYFVLELFDTGTANLRETPFSLRRAFQRGEELGARFFCTSQQEGVVDFSQYVTSHALWREGAVPMGALTTESVYTRLIAALVSTESESEAMEQMEEGS